MRWFVVCLATQSTTAGYAASNWRIGPNPKAADRRVELEENDETSLTGLGYYKFTTENARYQQQTRTEQQHRTRFRRDRTCSLSCTEGA